MRGVGTFSRIEAEESVRSKFSSPTEGAIPALEEFPSEKSPIASVDDTRPSRCGSSWEPASGTPKTVGRFRDVSHSERRGSRRSKKGSGGQGTTLVVLVWVKDTPHRHKQVSEPSPSSEDISRRSKKDRWEQRVVCCLVGSPSLSDLPLLKRHHLKRQKVWPLPGLLPVAVASSEVFRRKKNAHGRCKKRMANIFDNFLYEKRLPVPPTVLKYEKIVF